MMKKIFYIIMLLAIIVFVSSVFVINTNLINREIMKENGSLYKENTTGEQKDNEDIIQNKEEAVSNKDNENLNEPKLDFSKYSNLESKSSGWGFKRIKNSEPEIYQSTKDLFHKYNTYYIDERRTKTLYLTFDEGYENGYTGKILDTLKKCDVKAAFFVTGPYLKGQEELIKRMIDEGHIVGNHTVNHPNLAKSSPETISNELNELNKMFYEKYKVNMRYMRPPEGEYSEKVLAVANDMGYKTIFWSFAYKDWDTNIQKGEDYAFEQVTQYIHDGAIILLHAVSVDNANALERIINYAKDQGYQFATLDKLE